jgi:ERF superfamily
MADTTAEAGGAQPFPAEIAKAVIKIMGALGTLAKEREGKGISYKFASIDDFIDHVRGPFMEAGLFIIPNEAEPSRLMDVVDGQGKTRSMWWSRFAFTLVHTSGASYGPIFKTVLVHATGAQSAGAAQSYAMKQLDRGLFQIKTGDDDDPDKEKTDIRGRGENETDIQKKAGRIRRQLLQAAANKDLDELGQIWNDSSLTLDEIKNAFGGGLRVSSSRIQALRTTNQGGIG